MFYFVDFHYMLTYSWSQDQFYFVLIFKKLFHKNYYILQISIRIPMNKYETWYTFKRRLTLLANCAIAQDTE